MTKVALQLVTVDLEDGKEGIFIGVPLITDDSGELDSQIREIWFSSIQEIPGDLTVQQLMVMTAELMRRSRATLQ